MYFNFFLSHLLGKKLGDKKSNAGVIETNFCNTPNPNPICRAERKVVKIFAKIFAANRRRATVNYCMEAKKSAVKKYVVPFFVSHFS